MKDATPFRFPVDPEALKIPHYLQVIKHPMDFSTIERKLLTSNPFKPDPNTANPRYLAADDFIADVRLIFSNCVTFNGPEHIVTQQGKRVEAVFDKQIKQMPPPEEVRQGFRFPHHISKSVSAEACRGKETSDTAATSTASCAEKGTSTTINVCSRDSAKRNRKRREAQARDTSAAT